MSDSKKPTAPERDTVRTYWETPSTRFKGVAQNLRGRVTQVLVSGSIYPGACLSPLTKI